MIHFKLCSIGYAALLSMVLSLNPVLAKAPKSKATSQLASVDATARDGGATSQARLSSTEDGKSALRQVRYSLKDLGASRPLTLYGVQGDSKVGVSVRLDEVVEAARLTLVFTLSPALLPHLSHLKVYLNDEVLQTIVVDKEKLGTSQSVSFNISPRLFIDYNRLRFELIGHYTLDCEMPLHSSLWANISNASYLELSLRQLRLSNDLALLPAPFFDVRDNRPLSVPFVYAKGTSLSLLKASGSLSSWIGALSSYRGARFPVLENRLPTQQHAIVLASNDRRPDFLKDLPLVDKPTLSIISHPASPVHKLLLVLGKDDAQVQIAADALALGKAALTGQTMQVNAFQYPALRSAYDAPRWITSERPVQLAELVREPSELQVRGSSLNDAINISTHMAPDLFTWNASGVPLNLKYRYTPTRQSDNGALNVSINDQFVKSYPLKSADSHSSDDSNTILLPLFDDGTLQSKSNLKIPAFLIGGDNQLQFAFHIPPADVGRCSSTLPPELRAILDPQSTIDLSGFDHYSAMPNLAAFANSGFPFTKYADLSQTTVILPEHPTSDEIELFLTALGRMGASTGYAATQFHLITPTQADKASGTDILVLASASSNPLVAQWGRDLPALIEAGKRSVRPLTQALDSFFDLFNLETQSKVTSEGASAILLGNGPLAAVAAMESPLNRGRSVVVLSASDSKTLDLLGTVLTDPGKVRNMRGDLSLVRGDQLESFRVNPVFYVGDMPWWRRWWFQMHTHPLLLALFGLAGGMMIAFIVYIALRTLARNRLMPSDDK